MTAHLPKIAILADPLDNQRAGIHVFTRELIQALIRLGKADRLLLIRERYDPDMPVEQIVVPNTRLPIGFASLRLFFIVPFLLRRRKDVVAVFEPAHFGPFFLPQRIRKITMIHDLTPLLFPQYHRWHSQLLQKIFLKGILQRTDLILTNSQHTRQDVKRVFPFAQHKTETILLGKNPAFQPTSNLTRIESLGLVRPYFLFVGTIEPRKNLLTLLQAFTRFSQENDTHDLVIVGQVGWKAAAFEEAYERHPQQTRIHRLGYVDFSDLPVLYTHCTAMVYPSEYEGFGLPLVEAAACGAQLIVAANSSLLEVGEGAARFFSTYDAVTLAHLLHQSITAPIDRAVILAMSQRYDWEQCANDFWQFATAQF